MYYSSSYTVKIILYLYSAFLMRRKQFKKKQHFNSIAHFIDNYFISIKFSDYKDFIKVSSNVRVFIL